MSLCIRASEFSASDSQQNLEWKGKTGLMCLVLEAVQEVEWDNKGGTFAIEGGELFQSDLLMTLLTYCYSTGIYCSEEIEITASKHEELRTLWADNPPDWRTVRRFRRLHRDGVRDCLIHVVNQARLIRFGAPNTDPPLTDYYVALALDRWFDPLCVPSPGIEATNRIERAVIYDTILFD